MSPPNSAVGIFSAWFELSQLQSGVGITGVSTLFYAQFNNPTNMIAGFGIDLVTRAFKITLTKSPVTSGLQTSITSSPGSISSDSQVWNHVLASWDISGGSFTGSLYINDVLDLSVTTYNSGVVDWSSGNLKRVLNGNGSSPFDRLFHGTVTDVYVNTQEYLDFSIVSNRRKFITATGGYQGLYTDGHGPTGNSPSYYFIGGGSSFIQHGTEFWNESSPASGSGYYFYGLDFLPNYP